MLERRRLANGFRFELYLKMLILHSQISVWENPPRSPAANTPPKEGILMFGYFMVVEGDI
jgi:hypothetical protein